MDDDHDDSVVQHAIQIRILLGLLANRDIHCQYWPWICVKSFMIDKEEEHHQDLSLGMDCYKPSLMLPFSLIVTFTKLVLLKEVM